MTAEAHSRSTVYSQAVVIQRLLVNMGHDFGDQVPVSLDLGYLGTGKQNHILKLLAASGLTFPACVSHRRLVP